MTSPTKKPAAHKASWLAVALAVLALLTQVLQVFGPSVPTHHQIAQAAKPAAQAAARKAATRSLSAAFRIAAGKLGNAPPPANQTCNVPPGQGAMGACAPKAPTLRLASAASSSMGHHQIGADVSSYQGCQTHFQLAFVVTKATEGTGYTDRCLAQNVGAAKRSAVPYGTYDFMRATGTSATAEAAHYVAAVRAAGAAGGLHVLDVEAGTLPPGTLHSYACDWVSRVKHDLGGPVAIYTGTWFWTPRVGGTDCGVPLWVSAYASYAVIPGSWGGGTITPTSARNQRAPLWQYSDGVYGPFPRVDRWDTDAFYGSHSQLLDLFGQARPCSQRTACRMGRRHAHVHQTIARKCHPARVRAAHPIVCRRLHNRNRYMHGYARRHRLTLTTR